MPCDSTTRAWVLRAPIFLALPVLFAACLESPDPIALARERAEQADALSLQLSQAPAATPQEELAAMQQRAEFSLQEALTLYRVGRADLSDDPALLLEFSDVAERSAGYDLAGQAYRRLAEIGSEPVAHYLRAGINFARMDDAGSEQARAAFLNCLDANPEAAVAAEAHARLGRLALQQGLVANAERSVAQALGLNAEDREARSASVLLDCRQGRVVEAAAGMEVMLGMSGSESRRFMRDMKRMLAAMEADGAPFPADAEHELAYAKLLANTGRADDALGPLERAVALNSEDAFAWYMLGAIRLQRGENVAAQKALSRSLAINPNQPQVRQLLESLNAAPQ